MLGAGSKGSGAGHNFRFVKRGNPDSVWGKPGSLIFQSVAKPSIFAPSLCNLGNVGNLAMLAIASVRVS